MFVQEAVKEAVKEVVREEIRRHKLAQDNRLEHEWYSLSKCAKLKGVSSAYLCQYTDKHPGGGEKKICGVERFHISVVA